MNLTEKIYNKAHGLGFDLVGVAPVYPPPRLSAYRSWIARGYHGEMNYLARPDRVERREDPARILPNVRSIISVGLNYYPQAEPDSVRLTPDRGLVSNYAWGQNYHDLMIPRLETLAAFINAQVGGKVAHRVYVDTGPILERAYAVEAGLGFIGKNTCLLNPQMGSYLFLGEVMLDIPLRPLSRKVNVSCGTCRRCLEACPTGALKAPYVLDARRCISYLTIELKGAIPHELRSLIGNWIYGCDVCQVVCPWQRFAKLTAEQAFQAEKPDRTSPALLDLISMDEEAFRRQYHNTAIFRIGRGRLLRNAAVALGNWGSERAVPPLMQALIDAEPLVRGHAAWALGRIGGWSADKRLEKASLEEDDPYVQGEIRAAMHKE